MTKRYHIQNDTTIYYPKESIIAVSNDALASNIWEDISTEIENKIDSNITSSEKDSTTKKKKEYFKFEESFPVSAGILLTNKCPLRCTYCFYSSGDNDKMSLNEEKITVLIKHLIKNAKIAQIVDSKNKPEIKIIITGGGEPTANFELLQRCITIIRTLCAKNNVESFIHLVSNWVMSTKAAKYIVENINSCSISFDGLPSLQNLQRPTVLGDASFDVLFKTTKIFDKLGYHYSLRSTVNCSNFNQMNDMSDFVYSNFKGLIGWQIEPIYTGGRAENYDFEELQKFGNKFRELVEYSYAKYKKTPFNSYLSYKILDSFCATSAGTNFWIDAYGDIIHCAEHFDKKRFRIAHIEEQKLVEDLNEHESLFSDYKARMRKGCEECPALFHCAGGCPLRMRRDEDGKLIDEYAKNICSMTKAYWSNAILALANMKNYSEIKPQLLMTFQCKGTSIKLIKIKQNSLEVNDD